MRLELLSQRDGFFVEHENPLEQDDHYKQETAKTSGAPPVSKMTIFSDEA